MIGSGHTFAFLKRQLPVILLCLTAFLLTYFAPVSYARSDPELSLLVSQSILEHRTMALDAYRGQLQLSVPFEQQVQNGMMQQLNGRHYYLFPTGPSLFALPVVFAANLLGKDMRIAADNYWLQSSLSALLCALSFLLVTLISAHYVSRRASLIISSITVFGSALISTMGTAYWNTNFAVLFTLLALLLMVRYEGDPSRGLNGYLLGLLLFAAYLSRPTAAIFIALALLYLLLRNRRYFLQAASLSLLCLLLFLLWSRTQYGRWFPLYYRPSRLQVVQSGLSQAVFGLLLSPSRGLFVYSPFFIVTLGGILGLARRLWKKPLLWLALLWFVLHLPVPARTTRWWGGHSFGPRLLTEVTPALILLTLLVWRAATKYASDRLRTAGAGTFILLGLAAITINSGRGLYSHMPSRWNVSPNVDFYPETLFDWRYPQFLATAEALQERSEAFIRQSGMENSVALPAYRPGRKISAGDESAPALFLGWQPPAGEVREAETRQPSILFLMAQKARGPARLEIQHRSPVTQSVSLALNDKSQATLASGPALRRDVVTVNGDALQSGLNEITFAVSGVYIPGFGYLRRPRFGLKSLALLALLEEQPGETSRKDPLQR